MAVGRTVTVPVADNVFHREYTHPLFHVGNLFEALNVLWIFRVVDPLDQFEQVGHLVGGTVISPRRPAQAIIPRLNSVFILIAAKKCRMGFVLVVLASFGVGEFLPHLDFI